VSAKYLYITTQLDSWTGTDGFSIPSPFSPIHVFVLIFILLYCPTVLNRDKYIIYNGFQADSLTDTWIVQPSVMAIDSGTELRHNG